MGAVPVSIIYVMIPLALLLVALAVWALVWAIRSGQFDELESHGWTPVLDDDQRPSSAASASDDGGDLDARDANGAGTDGGTEVSESPGRKLDEPGGASRKPGGAGEA